MSRIELFVILAVPLIAGPVRAYPPQLEGAAAPAPQVWRAQDVVDALGVNTHINYDDPTSAYKNIPAVIAALKYLHVTHIRDNIPEYAAGDPRLQAYYSTVLQTGVIMDLIATGNTGYTAGYASIIDMLRANLDSIVANFPGQIMAVEGTNEPNLVNNAYVFKYRGLHGPAAVAQYQIDLRDMVQGDPLLSSIPVWEFTLNSPPYQQRQYELVYEANPRVLGAFDVANISAYPGIYSPEFQIMQAIVDPLDWGFNSHGFYPGPYSPTLQGMPVVVKESGLSASPDGIPSQAVATYDTQRKEILGALFDTLILGSTHSFVYELADVFPDPGINSVEYHYGLFDNHWKPKPAARILRHIMTQFTDRDASATTFVPVPLTVTVPQFPLTSRGAIPSGWTLTAQRADGTYVIAVWYEPLVWNLPEGGSVAPAPITVNLSRTCGQTEVYDPYNGSYVPGPTNASSVPLMLPDYAVLLFCSNPM